MGRSIGLNNNSVTITSVPLGGYADVFTGGDAYKLTGTLLNRANYAEMSSAFPRSSALNSFNSAKINESTLNWNAATFGAGLFLITGGASATNLNGVATSADGITWSNQVLPVALNYRSAAFGADLFILIGCNQTSTTNQYCTSPDGVTWTLRTFPVTTYFGRVIWSKELSLFIVSTGEQGINTAGYILTSPDGINWAQRAVPSRMYTGIASGPAGLVITSGDTTNNSTTVTTSVDGVTFVDRVCPAGRWHSVTYGRGLYVMVGYAQVTSIYGPLIATSPDGINWTLRAPVGRPSSLVTDSRPQICWGDGSFIAIWPGYTTSSADGITWAARPSLSAGLAGQIAFGAGQLLFGALLAQYTVLNVVLENNLDSNYMYMSGTTGKYVRVK